jgi:hypothetical protein
MNMSLLNPGMPPAYFPNQSAAPLAKSASFGAWTGSEGGDYNVPSWAYLASTAALGAGAYHGYKRTGSSGWAVGYALLAGAFWPIVVPVMLAQGFGEPAKRA